MSTWGRVYNTETQTFVPRELTRDRNIYVGAQIRDINNNIVHFQIHQLVARMFVLPQPIYPDGTIVVPNHIDGVKWHNEPYNLEWTTLSENTIHAEENNLIARNSGEDCKFAELTDAQYHEICRLTQEGYKANEIDKIMNVGFDITNIVQKIRTGTSVTSISQQYDFSNIPRNDYRKFTEDQVRYICMCLQDYPHLSYTDILIGLGFDIRSLDKAYYKKLRDTISTIKRRVSYIEIAKDYKF